MADLIDVLPKFDLKPWRHLIFSLEKKGILTAELVTLEPVEIVKKCPLPLKELRRFVATVVEALQADIGYPPKVQAADQHTDRPRKRQRREETSDISPRYVKTLDPSIDAVLGGGFPTGRITEIVGERLESSLATKNIY